MPMQIVEMFINEMPKIEAEQKYSRFEDYVMANPNIENSERQKYLNNLEKQMGIQKQKTSREAQLMQLQLMGIGVNEVDG